MKQNVNDVLKFRQGREEGAYEKAVEIAKTCQSRVEYIVQNADLTKGLI